MSMNVCLTQLQEKGVLDAERAARFAALYEARRADYTKAMGEAAASARATGDTMDAIEHEAAQRRRQELLQINAQQLLLKRLGEHVAGGGKISDAAMAVFTPMERAPGGSNLEMLHKTIRGQAHQSMTGVLKQFSHDIVGNVRNAAGLENMVRELHGTDTGDLAAKELAKAWRHTAEQLRQRFNAAGGHIGKLDDWGLPQSHSSDKVRNATVDEWRDFITPKLDHARMIDETTGHPFSAEALHEALGRVWSSIRSGGWDGRTAGEQAGKKLANSRTDQRFLVFRDADAWIEYQAQYGTSNAFDAMMGHIDSMSRDIAQMEVLGPNPSTTVKWLTDHLQQEVAVSSAIGKAHEMLDASALGAKASIERMYGIYTGELSKPVSPGMARTFGAVRSTIVAARLGSAAITALSDLGFQKVTADFNGLEYSAIVKNYGALLTDPATREFAIASGLVAEEASSRMGGLWRYDDSVNTPEIARRLSTAVIRASGLSAFTQAGKWAFGMEFMHALGHAAKSEWHAMDPALRGALERYGFDEFDWDVMRQTPLHMHKGVGFLRPDDVAMHMKASGLGGNLGTPAELPNRMMQMILTETNFAVPDMSLRSRAIMTAGQRPGTFWGEVTRSLMQFKGFSTSVMFTHGARALAQEGIMPKAKLAANVMLMTTMFGALAYQMQQVIAGKDPMDMTDHKFWIAAMLKGGGAGIYGDFLFSDTNQFNQTMMQTAAGPLISDAIKLGQIAKDAKTTATPANQKALSELAMSYIPGSSLWYARLAFNRVILDEVRSQSDPTYAGAFARTQQRAEKQFNQKYWWAPGAPLPERAPDATAINGGSSQ